MSVKKLETGKVYKVLPLASNNIKIVCIIYDKFYGKLRVRKIGTLWVNDIFIVISILDFNIVKILKNDICGEIIIKNNFDRKEDPSLMEIIEEI